MGKNLYEKYLDAIINIEVNLTLCVVQKIWVSKSYNFQDIILINLNA